MAPPRLKERDYHDDLGTNAQEMLVMHPAPRLPALGTQLPATDHAPADRPNHAILASKDDDQPAPNRILYWP